MNDFVRFLTVSDSDQGHGFPPQGFAGQILEFRLNFVIKVSLSMPVDAEDILDPKQEMEIFGKVLQNF